MSRASGSKPSFKNPHHIAMPVNKHLTLVTFCLLSLAATEIVIPATAVPTDRSQSVGLGKSPSTSTTIPSTNPRYTGTVKRVDDIAQQITVRIEQIDGGNGSGVIVAKQGDTYYVATAAHVVQDIKKVNGRKVPKEKIATVIVTPSQERITINPSNINIANVDLDVAVVKFQSRQNYRVADIGRYSFNAPDWVFISGFPGVERNKQHRLSIGVINARSAREFAVKSRDREFGSLSNGNGLVYSNLSLPGMSGGAVLDRQGRVVGINTGAENELAGGEEINFGFALGIPISNVLGVGGIPTITRQVTSTPAVAPSQSEDAVIQQIHLSTLPKPSETDTAAAWLDYGNLLWRSFKHRESVAAFKTAIKLLEREPDSGDRQDRLRIAYFGMGLAQRGNKDDSSAVAAFERSIKYTSQAYQSWRYLGRSLEDLRRYDEAVAAYRQAINYQKQDFVLYTELGNVLRKLKRYPEAISAYNTAIGFQPNHPWAYNNRGLAYKNLKQHERALADYNQAIKLDPQDAMFYSNRGFAYSNLKQYERALADANQAIKLDPQLASSYNNRGIVYDNLKQYERALADYNQAIKLDSQDAMAYSNRGLTYKNLKQYERALADANQAIKLDPQLAPAYYNRGIVYAALKQYNRALADYNQAIKLDPQDAMVYSNRGLVYTALKQYERALADYNQVIKLDIQDAPAYNNRGLAYNNLKQYERAIADYTQAIKLDPQLAPAYYNRGLIYTALKQDEQAIADYTQAIKLDPQLAPAYYNRGLIYTALKQDERAIADYTQAIKLDPQFAEAYNNRGGIYYSLKQYERALADAEKAAQIYLAHNDIQNYQRVMKNFQQLKAKIR
jgi:tetratricopeptide (TPR) repeat protein/S1-C subfamily serine protease